MSLLDSFIAFDFETTGIDPRSSEIIEVAAVRVESWQITGTLQTLVQPRTMPSASIEQLTGIKAADLKGRPSLDVALAKLRQFVGDTPLISHNAEFEASRLRMSLPVDEIPKVYDTVELARIAFPRLQNHRLGTLVDALALENIDQHRALSDTETLVKVFEAMVRTLNACALPQLDTLVALAEALPPPQPPLGPIVDLLREIRTESARKAFSSKPAPLVREGFFVSLPNTFGVFDGAKIEMSEQPEPIDESFVSGALGEDGAIARTIPSYEVRRSQIQMAREVTGALNEGETVLCEAGTGTGKSIAYLVPAVQWAVKNGRRVVVSTHTKNLQEQLFYKDLPLVAAALDVPVRGAVLKGRSNYICRQQWQEELRAAGSERNEPSRALLLPLVSWIEQTESGDLEENGAFQTLQRFVPGAYGMASRISSEGKSCSRKTCAHFERCFLTRIRQAAQQAHMIIVNHSLLFSDLTADHGVIGKYEDLVADEAHTLEETATDYLGMELSLSSIRAVLDAIGTSHAWNLLARIRNSVRKGKIDAQTRKSFDVQLGATTQGSELVSEKAEALFSSVRRILPRPAQRSVFSFKHRYSADNNVFSDLQDQRDELLQACKNLRGALGTLALWLRDLPLGGFADRDQLEAETEQRQADVARLADCVDSMTRADDPETVYWCEIPAQNDDLRLKFVSAPLNVGSLLRSDFYPGLRSLVMTSATLSVAGKFTYFRNRLGLEDEAVRTLTVKSPFDFENQVHIALPAWFPEPRDPSFESSVISLLGVLIPSVQRGTLVLFTAHQMLDNAYNALKRQFEEQGILLLGQKIDGSRSSITNRFRDDTRSVLFGTESFWQGIDVPGEALELLVIVKLPFAVPDEPLEVAQSEALAAAGKDPFLHLTVPKAAIRFKQGFGRLIRHRNDRGAVLILDVRVVNKFYGRAFHQSLPAAFSVYRSQEELVAGFQAWFDAGRSGIA